MMSIAPPYSSELVAAAGNGTEEQETAWALIEDDFTGGIALAKEERKLAFINWTGKL